MQNRTFNAEMGGTMMSPVHDNTGLGLSIKNSQIRQSQHHQQLLNVQAAQAILIQ